MTHDPHQDVAAQEKALLAQLDAAERELNTQLAAFALARYADAQQFQGFINALNALLGRLMALRPEAQKLRQQGRLVFAQRLDDLLKRLTSNVETFTQLYTAESAFEVRGEPYRRFPSSGTQAYRDMKGNQCYWCGLDLTGLPQPAVICPNCGRPPYPAAAPDLRQAAKPAADQYVRAFVALAGTDVPVSATPLLLHTSYEVLCSIGPPDVRSVLPAEDAKFPRTLLPAGDLELRAVLQVEGAARVEVGALKLPGADGASNWVRLPLPVADAPTTIHAELAIYYEVVAVHVQVLILPVGGPVTAGGPSAHKIYQLSKSLADLGRLGDRHASVVLSDQADSSTILVNGLTFAPNAFAIAQNAADNAVKVARLRMYDIHFRPAGADREISRYAAGDTHDVPRHGKTRAEFVADLARLASAGRDLYDALFRDNVVAGTLADLVRSEAGARERVPVIQVVDLSLGHLPVPWALLYDLPLSGSGHYEPCPSIDDFGPGSQAPGEIPLRCPYEDRHRDTDGRWRNSQLCPWGFWGLSAVLEHPPYVDRALEGFVSDAYPAQPYAFLMAIGSDLDGRLRDDHLGALDREISVRWNRPPIRIAQDLESELAAENMDVVYFYCHCDYREDAPGIGLKPYLRFNETEQVAPSDISAWALSSSWPNPHWPDRHPLVVINGCRTLELQSGSLGDFVDAFANRAGAAGVLGTEITIDQGVASWAMELFFTALSRGATVGTALRQTRWAMFARGNLMGFAYTPYCLANLALRRGESAGRAA